MSRLANAILSVAKAVANARGSKLGIRVKEHKVEYAYVPPENTDSRVWEDFYSNAAIYVGNMANPVKVKPSEIEEKVENYVTTAYYESFMKQNVIEQAFSTKGEMYDTLMKLQIGTIVGIVMVVMVILAT